ncbi:MAG: hypothetical protein R3240_05495, partial [Gammaproteobacteria bacterium]|nr:hypothetical protein [Gammaproteobacteria bacterium]
SAAGKTTTTDLNGYYKLMDVPVPASGLLVLTYEKDGYATFQRTVPVAANETYTVTAHLLQHQYSEQVDAASQQDLTVEDPANPGGAPKATLSFPAGSLGSGNVTVNVAVGDPTTEEGRPTFPGDYMAATTQGGEADTPLESVVFTEITVKDANGDEVTQVTEPASVTVRLPDSLQSAYSAGDEIPWWSYDETNATWIREDADPATPDTMDKAVIIDQGGVLYAQAKVTHFSWWNVDEPIDQHSCLCAQVVDDNNQPLVGVQLIAEGVSYNGRSRPASTDTNGKGCVTVKRSSDTVTEKVRMFVEQGNVTFPYNVTDAAEGDVDTNYIFTPTIAGSTVYNTGQCVDLNNKIALRYDGRIIGKVTYEGSNTPVADYVINTDFGASASTDNNGDYQINAPLGLPVTLFAVGQTAKTVTVDSADTPVTVNFSIANRNPVIDSISRVPTGAVTNGQVVNLTVVAHDDDNDVISFSWTADQGSFNTSSGAAVNWTAPATGAGTATLTVTASDNKGGQSQQDIAIVYSGGTASGNSLSFIFKDKQGSDQPVSGIIVALYNTDNQTIATTKTSGADGIVDFGVIGRSRASFTIVYEMPGNNGERIVESFVDLPVADNIVYYQENELDSNFDLGTTVANVNYTLSAVPANPGLAQIQPSYAWWSYPSNTGLLTNRPIYESNLQTNGKLSLLAMINSADNTGQKIGYGFLLDQTVTEGATFDIPLNRLPVTTGWTAQPATDLSYVDILGFRGGVAYSLADTPDYSSGNNQVSPTLQVPVEFPVDYYAVYGGVENTSTERGSEKRYTTLPQTVTIPIPDYNFSNVTLNKTSGMLSWNLTGSTAKDVIDIEFVTYGELERRTSWSIHISPVSTSLQLMTLPAPANSWFDTTTFNNLSEADIQVMDFDFVSGIDELWQFFITGESVDQAFNQGFNGWYNLLQQNAAQKVQSNTVSQSSVNKRTASNSSLMRLRRQQ